VTRQPPRLVNDKIVTAMGHPTRVHAVMVLNQRTASPSELARELNRSVRHVSYHLDVLEKLGSIELVSRQPAGGGRVMESFYRATERSWFDREAWEQVADDKTRIGVTMPILSLMSEDIATAMLANTFEAKDNHVSRTPLAVDDQGWDEVVTLLSDTLDELIEIQARINERLTPETETKLAKVAIVQFQSPDAGKREVHEKKRERRDSNPRPPA
jgi:DNA-binding transcriptional ArsR family regulator